MASIATMRTDFDPQTMKRFIGVTFENIGSDQLGTVLIYEENGEPEELVQARNIVPSKFEFSIDKGTNVSMVHRKGEYQITDSWLGPLTDEQAESLQLDHRL